MYKNNNIDYSVLIIIIIALILRIYFSGHTNLLVEEAYYWNYANHLDFGYLDHPPMVALLIKIANILFGFNELSIRMPSFLCWILTIYFSYKLTHLIKYGAGQYAILLITITPFFFLEFLIITPDQPLIACWSAVLYCLYNAIILKKSYYWYYTGIWFGLGLLSKYTIVLVALSLLIYLLIDKDSRHFFLKKEPYLCAVISVLLFTPVIYWNATHGWASFIFQSTRRFESVFIFSLHHVLGLIILFLLPIGCSGLFYFLKPNCKFDQYLDTHIINSKKFLRIFTIVPLAFFMFFSLTHAIKFDWIGPIFLALIPWLAILLTLSIDNIKKSWIIYSIILLISYSLIILGLLYWCPIIFEKKILQKFISWSNLTMQFNKIAKRTEMQIHSVPYFVPLDSYNIGSELTFYQHQFFNKHIISKIYTVLGSHIFGGESLMFKYWTKNIKFNKNPLILISTNKDYLIALKTQIIPQAKIKIVWSYNQKHTIKVVPYYYQIVKIHDNNY